MIFMILICSICLAMQITCVNTGELLHSKMTKNQGFLDEDSKVNILVIKVKNIKSDLGAQAVASRSAMMAMGT